MDFFEHQETARKKSGRLILLFGVAVAAIAVMVYFSALLTFGALQMRSPDLSLPWFSQPGLFKPKLFLATTSLVLFVITVASLYKTASLRGGGRAVAESLGARLLEPGSSEPHERKLLNVVEEMAIASGIPVPQVFVMDREHAINAFAAGFTQSDAVIGVTRGCIQKLSRDELQGVIAHEFSHIFNGDMRLNLRLMGVLHGILVIGLIGQFVLRSSVYSGGMGSRRRRLGRNNGVIPTLVFGAALAVIGWIGTIFGNLIQSAVSRHREYLADASAVQYTRNPKGIAGALKKIGGLSSSSHLMNPSTAEVSHMLFGAGAKRGFISLFATHPPLVDRIRRIQPRFNGKFPVIKSEFTSPYAEGGRYSSLHGFDVARSATETAEQQHSAEPAIQAVGASALSLIGRPSPAHVAYAQELIAGIGAPLHAAAHEPYGARALIYGLLMDRDHMVRTAQLATLGNSTDPGVFAETKRLLPEFDALDPSARLALIDLSLPALRELSPDQYRAFNADVTALIRTDERVDAFEWVLLRVLLQHLAPNFGRAQPRPAQYYSLAMLTKPCSMLLSTLAHLGQNGTQAVSEAFEAGAQVLDGTELALKPRAECTLAALGKTLDQLERVSFPLKRRLLEAGAATIAHDHEITVLEGEVFRATADSLGCPIPPLLPGQPLSATAG